MGKIDVLTKNYVRNKRNKKIFADAFNYYIYDGEQVIDPEKLREIDTEAVSVPYGEDNTGIKIQPVQRIRDAFCSVMADDDAVYMLLGIENQTEDHFAMPVKNMLYDAMEYAAQVQAAAGSHRKAENYGTSAEFLSGFHKTDKLLPVVTLVIYWGDGEWQGPRSIHNMMSTKNEAVLRFVGNYEINLIIPRELSYEEAEKFSSDLGKALMYIKNKGNPAEIKRMTANDRYRKIGIDTGILLKEIMNFEYHLPENEEVFDMCYAIEAIKQEAVDEALKAAKKSERKAVILNTIETYRECNIAETDIENKIIQRFILSAEDAKEYMQAKGI